MDPRKAKTIEEACKNPDGKTFNAIRLLSFLSECISPGHGVPEDEVRTMAEEIINRKKGDRPNGTE